MIVSLQETFHAYWTLKGHSELATYDLKVYIEGPDRDMMSDCTPIVKEVKALENTYISKVVGRSSLEALALYIRNFVNRYLSKEDHLVKIVLQEDGHFTVTLDGNTLASSNPTTDKTNALLEKGENEQCV